MQVCSVSGEVDDFITEVHQFEEDGELIQMEINDGGAAVAEFESDPRPETESETESDSDGEPHCESAAEEIAEESESKSDSEVDSTKAPDKGDKTAKNNKGSKSQRKSMEDKLDNLSSTLEVMKDFFLNSGMLNNSKRDQGNTPKKRQGGGDRDCQAEAKRKKSLQDEEVRARDHAGQVICQAEAAKSAHFCDTR